MPKLIAGGVGEEHTNSTRHPILHDLNIKPPATFGPHFANRAGPSLFPEDEKARRHAVFANVPDVHGPGAALDRLEGRLMVLLPTGSDGVTAVGGGRKAPVSSERLLALSRLISTY